MPLENSGPRSSAAAVRPLQRSDLRSAADLHHRELGDGFLARLGPGFLKAYLSTFLDGPGAVALAAAGPDGAVLGFVVGSTGPAHNRVALRRHWRSLLPRALAGLSRHPGVALSFLRTRAGRYGAVVAQVARERQGPPEVRPGGHTAVLLHVAVEASSRGQGLGAALVRGFEQAARDAGCPRARLVAFGGPKDFYTRLGWDLLGSRVRDDGMTVVTYGRPL